MICFCRDFTLSEMLWMDAAWRSDVFSVTVSTIAVQPIIYEISAPCSSVDDILFISVYTFYLFLPITIKEHKNMNEYYIGYLS